MARQSQHFICQAEGKILLLTLLLTMILAAAAQAQYVAEPLPGPTILGGVPTVTFASYGQQVGQTAAAGGNAILWNGPDGALIVLGSDSIATGLSASQQSGAFAAYTLHGGSGKGGGGSHTYWHAALWSGSALSRVDLNPVNSSESRALAIYAGTEVGWAGSAFAMSACLWKSTAASAVDLNPTGYTQSVATAIRGSEQVGYGYPPYDPTGPGYVALLWTGTAESAVDLHPESLPQANSMALGVDGASNTQVGEVITWNTGSPAPHAYLWHGTAASAVDLNPLWATSSVATATRDGMEVGYTVGPSGYPHATVWHGTAASAIDLEAFLPNAGATTATGIDADGTIVGMANSGTQPFVLRPTTAPTVGITQSPLPDASGVVTHPVTLKIESPYTSLTASLTYTLLGSVPVTVTGTQATVLLSKNGTAFLSVHASDGLGHSTLLRQYTVLLDTLLPQTTLSNLAGTITLTAKDAGGYPVTTYYVLDGGPQITYKAPFAVPNTNHTIIYWSVDPHGNTETAHVQSLAAVAPTLTALSQVSALSGSPATTLTLTGTGFNATSQVSWNGTALPTVFVSASSLQATVPAASLTTPGSAKILVSNPVPGVGQAAPLTFTIFQRAVATGSGQDTGGPAFDLSPVTSSSGFTVANGDVPVVTTTATQFLDPNGSAISPETFFDTVVDGQSLTATGVYGSGKLTAWTVQMH